VLGPGIPWARHAPGLPRRVGNAGDRIVSKPSCATCAHGITLTDGEGACIHCTGCEERYEETGEEWAFYEVDES
jgi:hypothetical protein